MPTLGLDLLLRPSQMGNVWRPTILPFDHLVWCCLINLKAIKNSIKQLKQFLLFSFFVLVFDGRSFVLLASCIKHVWRAHAYHACSVACIHVLFTYVVTHSSLLVEFDLS